MSAEGGVYRVRLNPLLTTTGGASLTLFRFGGWLAVAFGTLMLVLSLAGAVSGTARGELDLTAVLVALVLFGGLTALGFWALRRARANDEQSRLLRAEHAFLITSTTLEFPGFGDRRAESWPLDATRTSSSEDRLGVLELHCPGFRSRTYQRSHLAESPREIQERIMAAQRRLAEGDQRSPS